jgi:pilus assembly protein CpaE
MSVRPVFLVTNQFATSNAVAAVLASNGALLPEQVCRDLGELASRLERTAAPAALIDIDVDPRGTLSALEPIARRYSGTRFIVLSTSMSSELLFEAMQIGARHFLLKDSIAADLIGVLHRVCPESPQSGQGDLVTVLSAGGGCGATTFAVNLANELRLASAQPALVVDLDACYGAVGAYLGVDGDYGILDLLGRGGVIDRQLVETTTLAGVDQVKALISTSTARLGDPVAADADRLGMAVKVFKDCFGHTVVDAPRVPLKTAAVLARASARTYVLLQLTIKDIGAARRMINGLAAAGIPAESIVALVNRYRKRGSAITLEETQRVLGETRLECLSNDYPAASEAINMGKPLAQAAGRSGLRRDIQKLAEAMVQSRKQDVSPRTGR